MIKKATKKELTKKDRKKVSGGIMTPCLMKDPYTRMVCKSCPTELKLKGDHVGETIECPVCGDRRGIVENTMVGVEFFPKGDFF